MNQIEEAIQSIDKEIDELQKSKQFLESVDISYYDKN